MLPEIGMLDRVLIARLAILPVKALMGRNDRLFGWKVENGTKWHEMARFQDF